MEVEGDGVPQAGDKNAELTLIQVNPTDLMAVGEDDEWLKWI